MTLPENILRAMSPADRIPLGKAGKTLPEISAAQDAKSERELQNQIANLLRQRDIYFVRSRMDKRTTTSKGTPDFVIVTPKGHALAVECKTPKGKLSDGQEKLHAEYWRQTGTTVHVIRDLRSMQELLNKV